MPRCAYLHLCLQGIQLGNLLPEAKKEEEPIVPTRIWMVVNPVTIDSLSTNLQGTARPEQTFV
jgi:hypothetical protein